LPTPVAGSGDGLLDRLAFPMRVGAAENIQDGVIGYYAGLNFQQIIRAPGPEYSSPSGYVRSPREGGFEVGFAEHKPLVLLMDPFGSVEASVGILPAKTLALPAQRVRRILSDLEISFRVMPVLGTGAYLPLPVLAPERGQWKFQVDGRSPEPAAPYSPAPRFDNAAPAAIEGRLILSQTT
jgi:hypothetical protein